METLLSFFQGFINLGAAVMVLIPRMVGIMMEGLSPIGTAANAYMKKKIGEDADVYIGMDIALGLGDPCCITCTAIMIPLTIVMAFIIPDMRFFPLGILAEVCYLAPMCPVLQGERVPHPGVHVHHHVCDSVFRQYVCPGGHPDDVCHRRILR